MAEYNLTKNRSRTIEHTPVRHLSFVASVTTLLVIVSATNVKKQEEGQEKDMIHPYMYCDPNYPDQPCSITSFCNFESGELNNSMCELCPESSRPDEECRSNSNLADLGVQSCLENCVTGRQEGSFCNDDMACAPGEFFCNFESGSWGVCEQCMIDASECVADSLLSERGMESCLECKLMCSSMHFSSVTLDDREEIPSTGISGSPALSASGPLVDCTNLVYDKVTGCPGANNSECVIEDVTKNTWYPNVVWKCEKNGGVAVVLFADYINVEADQPFDGMLSYKETKIPSVSISYIDGKRLIEQEIGTQANVTVETVGDLCWKEQICSDDIPCLGRWANSYCGYDFGGDEGVCWHCPRDENDEPDLYGCFFDRIGGYVKPKKGIEQCTKVCPSAAFGHCKFCPNDAIQFEFSVEKESDRCHFCPENDVKFPDREVPIFGKGTTCWQTQRLFESVDIHKYSQSCRLAQMMNYICGCEGPGYAGASSDKRKAVLAWLPRAVAILSFVGSSFIVYDAVVSGNIRRKTFSQLMVVLSIFDMIGSCAYAFTSLPMPADDFMYGSIGNMSSCITQGFFIQLGTISCYTNVSLSVYYFLVIKKGWREGSIKKKRIWFFSTPIIIGSVFAFAGIPFYDNMILWCNNAASWWPDIPVAVAIILATAIMGMVCCDVYQKEKASLKWRGGGTHGCQDTLSEKVFWQSFWYITAFYVTWVPYLALQYTWASGKAFSNYGLILFAGTLVPMQGVWNCFVYVRPRYLKDFQNTRASISTSIMSSRASVTSRRISAWISKRKAQTNGVTIGEDVSAARVSNKSHE